MARYIIDLAEEEVEQLSARAGLHRHKAIEDLDFALRHIGREGLSDLDAAWISFGDRLLSALVDPT